MDTSQMACKNRLSKDTYVAVDIKKKKKIVSLEVTSEEVHDSKMLKKMVDNASKNNVVKRVLADDGTYMTVR
jgi:predicted transport protein